jgi:hypothetical protein
MRSRSQLVRRTAAGVAGLALALTAAAALPADAAPDSTRTSTTSTSAVAVAAAPSISITASKTKVKAWSQFVLKGNTKGVAANTTVTVQRLQSNKWVNFPARTKVTSRGTYSVRVESGRVGVNTFRVVAGRIASKSVKVTVTK